MEVMAMNRKERRRIAKVNGTGKIRGTNRPVVNDGSVAK